MIEQKTEGWFAERAGHVTASRVIDVVARTKSGYSAARKNYMMELLCQRLTGKCEPSFTSAAMQRGVDLEAVARSVYEIKNNVVVLEAPFKKHPTIKWVGASPDGEVGNEGLIEIKCPNTATHLDYLRTGNIDKKYILQMQLQMECTGRKWCDFVSYDDRLPEDLSYGCTRIDYSPNGVKEMMAEIKKFLAELEQLEAEVREMRAA